MPYSFQNGKHSASTPGVLSRVIGLCIWSLAAIALVATNSRGALANTANTVVINKVMAQTATNGHFDAEWLELANGGQSAVNISGWRIVDGASAYTFPALSPPLTLAAGERVAVWGRNHAGGYAQGDDGQTPDGLWQCFMGGFNGSATPPHGIFLLHNSGDTLLLTDQNGTWVDWFSYQGETPSQTTINRPAVASIDPAADQSLHRCPDAAMEEPWVQTAFDNHPGQANACAAAPTATPTVLPTAATTPTLAPTPTPTETPTLVPTATPTASVNPTSSPTPTSAPTVTPNLCCQTFTMQLRPGWNQVSLLGVPSFGLGLRALVEAMQAQQVPVQYLALWEGGTWYLRGPAMPIPIPAAKQIPFGAGIMMYCATTADFTFTACWP